LDHFIIDQSINRNQVKSDKISYEWENKAKEKEMKKRATFCIQGKHYLVYGDTINECIKKMYAYLIKLYPKTWAYLKDWKALKDEIVEYGNQEMEGPHIITEIK